MNKDVKVVLGRERDTEVATRHQSRLLDRARMQRRLKTAAAITRR